MNEISKGNLYRIPWSLYDNPIGWVEVTDECNMYCKGCYRNYIETREGHKSLDDIKKEVLFMLKERNVSEISLAGGEPLLHPHIADIVGYISTKKLGVKIFTNGLNLTQEIIHELALAGLTHVTFHVDSGQTRNDEWDARNEIDLNSLRQCYVNLCQKEKHLTVSFSIMVTKKNLRDIPSTIEWALGNEGKVEGLTFIAVRSCRVVENGNKPKMLMINPEENVTSEEIYSLIKGHYPKYEVSAYLGGTVNPKSFKWLFSLSICSAGQMLGSVSPISIELHQVLRRLFHGRYVLNDHYQRQIPRYLTNLICFFRDTNIQKVLWNLIGKPRLLQNHIHLLRLIVIQGHDISLSGDMDMCDGCPDMTYFQGRLVNSCRLDEFRKYGHSITDFSDENRI
jgi:sulfatase maturation enzyme AslB (radical SAM superfamily)